MTQNEGQAGYIPSKYSKQLNWYSRTQIKTVMPLLGAIAKTCQHSAQYPVCKVLKAISKIFLLNQIEVIFLGYLIRETQWDITDRVISNHAQTVQDIVCYSSDNPHYRAFLLYLMVTAYTVKYYLNENSVEAMDEAVKRCPHFKQVFQTWAKKHSAITNKINPRTLNHVYKSLYGSFRTRKPDFNMMVDAILQISPAYNPEREKGKDHSKKVPPVKKEDPPSNKLECSLPHPPMFSSSVLMGLAQLSQQEHSLRESVNLNQLMGRSERIGHQLRGLLGNSSVYGGLTPNYDLKDEDCGELVVGLHDGQSQENIIFDERGGNQSQPASIVSLTNSKGFALTDKYLTFESKMGRNNDAEQ